MSLANSVTCSIKSVTKKDVALKTPRVDRILNLIGAACPENEVNSFKMCGRACAHVRVVEGAVLI